MDTVEQLPSGDLFELVYDGLDVRNGTMNAREVVEAVSGLSKAFSIVAHERGLGDEYELRFKDVDHASFHLVFEAIAFAKANPAATSAITAGAAVGLNAVTNVVSGAYKVVTDIGALITAKKKLKGERVATTATQFSEFGVQLKAGEELIVLTKEQYELLLSQRVDRPLAQIVSPLSPAHVDQFEIRRAGIELATVSASERAYFDHHEIAEEKSREGTEITGTLNSLTKTSLRGTFYTSDGVHVPYRYTGGDIAQLLRGFASKEPLRVRGRVKYGNDGLPISLEINELDSLQRSFL